MDHCESSFSPVLKHERSMEKVQVPAKFWHPAHYTFYLVHAMGFVCGPLARVATGTVALNAAPF
jgi:hypothetical protein